jgi:hypothetical protein
MLHSDPLKVLGQGFFHGYRKHGVAVLVPLSGSDHDLISGKAEWLGGLDPGVPDSMRLL